MKTIYLILDDIATDVYECEPRVTAAYTSDPTEILPEFGWIEEIELEELDAEKISAILAERARQKVQALRLREEQSRRWKIADEEWKRESEKKHLEWKHREAEKIEDAALLARIKSGELKIVQAE